MTSSLLSKERGAEEEKQEEKEEGRAGPELDQGMMSAIQARTYRDWYNEMFRFNSAVMGFGASPWMGEVLDCFHKSSLRSLFPKDWSPQHEVSWEKTLGKVLAGLVENTRCEKRNDIAASFFAAAPARQDFFKQSNTYLHFMVDDISALEQRHYAIPT
jgi:hypothetical protein